MAIRFKIKAVLGCVIIAALATRVLSTNQYYKREFFGGVTALSNTNEAFIFLQINTTVEKVRRWNLLMAKCFGVVTPDNPQTKRNLIVFRSEGLSLKQYRQEDFDVTGQLIPFDNTFYLVHGGYSVSVFAWREDHFVEVARQEANRIRSLVTADKGQAEKSGWKRLDWEELGHVGDNYDKTFTLGNSETLLHIKTGAPILNARGYVTHFPKVKIELSINGQRRMLLDLSQDYTKISSPAE